MHDNELWLSYQEGDVKALEGLYELYYSPLTNYGFKFTRDHICIEESVQELFLMLWQNRERVARTTLVKQYLYLSFRRMLLRKLEYGPARQEEELAGEHIPFQLELKEEHPLIGKERMAALAARVGAVQHTLTNREREVVFLKYYEGLSYEEITGIMHLNINGTYQLLYRALERLRRHFGGFTLLLLLYILKRS